MHNNDFLVLFALALIIVLGHMSGYYRSNSNWQEKLIALELAHYQNDAKTGETTFVINVEKK
jgi:hypothetical protein